MKNLTFKKVTLDKVKFTGTNGDRFVILSDVHLGHPQVASSKITQYLLNEVLSLERMQSIDCIVITGDLFDRRIYLDTEDAVVIKEFILTLLLRCVKTNTRLRVLEGTRSHDNKQARWFIIYNELLKYKADVRYYSQVTVDTLWEGGPTALWVPDEVNVYDATLTQDEVTNVCTTSGYSKVDFAFMHGMFGYQEPFHRPGNHSEEFYLRLVKHAVFIGHNHTHTRYKHIFVPGSLERMTHGQEEHKGHLEFTFNVDEGIKDAVFVINKDASIYKTLDLVGKSIDEVYDILDTDAPAGSKFRLKVHREDDAFKALSEIRKRFHYWHIDPKVVDVESSIDAVDETVPIEDVVVLTKETLENIIMARVSKENPQLYDKVRDIVQGG